MWLVLGASLIGILLYSKDSIADTIEENMDTWNKWDDLFKKYGKKWDVNWKWLKAIALNESSLGKAKSVKIGLENPNDVENSKSSDGLSWGLMQVTLKTAQEMDRSATPQKLNDPEYSINMGARYISKMKDLYLDSEPRYVEWVIKSYNQGPGNTNKEKKGLITKGYADEYWLRFQNNLKRIK
jgi:membrane-bound lytic murein transglycosylase MltF